MNQSLSYQQNWSALQKSFPTSIGEAFIGIVAQIFGIGFIQKRAYLSK